MTQVQQQNNPLAVLDQQFIDRKAEFVAVLPQNVTVEKFTRIVKTAAIQTPDLLVADRPSLFMACFKAAQDGLLPDGRESALVIYNTKQKDGTWKKLVQYMPMFGGILKKIRNSGELATINANVVYENDYFDYELGDNERIIHKPALSNRGKVIGAYAIAKTKDDAIYREVMSLEEIEKVRASSKSKDNGPWVTWYEEMCRKTVIRRLAKRLPMSTDVEEVIRRDDELYDFTATSEPVKQAPQVSLANELKMQQPSGVVIDITKASEVVEHEESELDINPELLAKAEEKFK